MTAFAALSGWWRVCEGQAVPALRAEERATISAEYDQLLALLAAGVPVYGSNTRPGHREAEAASPAEQQWRDVLDSHAIGEGPWYDRYEARCIGVAKLAAWRAGGSGVSPALFDHLSALLGDDHFQPQVPRGNSYSAGDVIPATHWAQAVLQGSPRTGRFAGEPQTMPLINGAFVHAGLALSTLRPLRRAWVLFYENTMAMAGALGNTSYLRRGPEGLAAAAQPAAGQLRAELSSLPERDGPQDPLSLRATDELFEVLLDGVAHMARKLEEALGRPSGNPLIRTSSPMPLSQGSFMLMSLTAAQSALAEALLAAMWAQVGRTAHLLSGRVPGVPRDAATAKRPLGFIQHPKRMMAILEEARLLAGRRAFASGASTSYGIEDLWSHGLNTTEVVLGLADRFAQLGAIEALVLRGLREADFLDAGADPSPGSLLAAPEVRQAASPAQLCAAAAAQLDGASRSMLHGFPVPA